MSAARRYATPALRAWWAELHAGTRTARTFDVLREAAGWEQRGLDALALGFDDAAARDFARAVELLRKAAA